MKRSRFLALVAALALLPALSGALSAQSFDSGSTGADGALTLTTPGTIDFDPASFTPPLDPDGDNVYHFTSVTIGPGVTVRLRGPGLNMSPVWWLASGPVVLDGTIDLSGDDGQHGSVVIHDGSRSPAVPGAGGFPGGVGGTTTAAAQTGSGPGGGLLAQRSDHSGGGAAHVSRGSGDIAGPPAYGNPFLLPLLGGSGGAGAHHFSGNGGGGGAGGGAILIASSISIVVNGAVRANGGSGGATAASHTNGGGGSGGTIHLLAPSVGGSGALSAIGGNPSNTFNLGSPGRIRLEAFQTSLAGSVSPGPVRATPFTRSLTPAGLPSVRIVTVGAVAVAEDPTGSFEVPDVTIGQAAAVPVEIEARNVPPGTVVRLHVFSEGGADQIVNASPLVGTLAQSTATASVVFPPGFSRGFVRATWMP
jgi:hypothetical protein